MSGQILATGGEGVLGTQLRKILPETDFPLESEFDITDIVKMENWLKSKGKEYNVFLHCAAFVSPPLIDKDPVKALDVNIVGTANIARLCIQNNIKLVYICTDYVFDGKKGNYKEADPVYPVNKYAWSKLGGECAVRMYDNSIVIRLSFGPNIFPYEAAFIDQWTSRESVTRIAEKIKKVLSLKDFTGVIHIGAKRRTVMEYAKELNPEKEIKELSLNDVKFVSPKDTSLNTDKYENLIK